MIDGMTDCLACKVGLQVGTYVYRPERPYTFARVSNHDGENGGLVWVKFPDDPRDTWKVHELKARGQ